MTGTTTAATKMTRTMMASPALPPWEWAPEGLGSGAHSLARIWVFIMHPSSSWGRMWQCSTAYPVPAREARDFKLQSLCAAEPRQRLTSTNHRSRIRCRSRQNLGFREQWAPTLGGGEDGGFKLSDDFLHGVGVLVGQAIQGACTGPWPRHLGVGEVEESRVTGVGDNLISVCGVQRGMYSELAKKTDHFNSGHDGLVDNITVR
ncbi:MAG: hypothetical protein FRX49_07423 [Trebouxia sp. A1-2]|nr:MAG: hypothetical protein FRX49_07423 [Trebouxia sp. A1-2]